jgi:hypothetical protein
MREVRPVPGRFKVAPVFGKAPRIEGVRRVRAMRHGEEACEVRASTPEFRGDACAISRRDSFSKPWNCDPDGPVEHRKAVVVGCLPMPINSPEGSRLQFPGFEKESPPRDRKRQKKRALVAPI